MKGVRLSRRWTRYGKSELSTVKLEESDLLTILDDTTSDEDDSSQNEVAVDHKGVKIVFSDFPKTMKESDFLLTVGELPPHDYFYFKPAMRMGTIFSPAAAVINFLYAEDAALWVERLAACRVIDEQAGIEYSLDISVMLNQEVPGPNLPKDELMGTLEETEEYKKYLEALVLTKGVAGHMLNPDGKITTDLLLQEVEKRHSDKKIEIDTPLVSYLKTKIDERIARSQSRARASREDEDRRKVDVRKKKEREEKREKDRRKKDQRQQERREERRKKREAARKEKKEKDPTTNPAGSKSKEMKSATTVSVKSNPERVPEAEKSVVKSQDIPAVTTKREVEDKLHSTAEKHQKTTGHNENNDHRNSGNVRSHGVSGSRRYRGSNNWDRDWDARRHERGVGNKEAKTNDTSNQADKTKTRTDEPNTSSKVTTGIAKEIHSSVQANSAEQDQQQLCDFHKNDKQKEEAKKVGKKKIIKKIITVRKPKTSDATNPSATGAAGDARRTETKSSLKCTQDSTHTTATISDNPADIGNGTTNEKTESRAPRRNRTRPDVQIYRPGQFRRNSGAGLQKDAKKEPASTTGGNGQSSQAPPSNH